MVGAREPEELSFATEGGCMRPWLWAGGTLIVRRCSVEELRIGDVAVWFDGTQLRSHRVVKLDHGRFVTRGDLSIDNDPPGSAEQLVGRGVRTTVVGITYSLDRPAFRWLGRLSSRAFPQALALLRRLKAHVKQSAL